MSSASRSRRPLALLLCSGVAIASAAALPLAPRAPIAAPVTARQETPREPPLDELDDGDGRSSDPSSGSAEPSLPRLDRAVERGLAWLIANQESCGGWVGDVGHKQEDGYAVYDTAERQRREGHAHVGVSALAGLALLADGKPVDTGPYAATFDRLIGYVTRSQDEFGYLCDGTTRMYSHSFALLFLSQLYGMTQRHHATVERALTKAVAFTESAQNEHGAWRYQPFTLEADLSVTVCQVQSLRAARDAGIAVKKSVIDRVVDYVRDSRIDGGRYEGAFYYKIYGRGASSKTSYAINAAAVTTLHSAGLYDPREYGGALDYLAASYDDVARYYDDHFYFWYGNWYAAQAFFSEGGPRWRRYWQSLSTQLLSNQQTDGRWLNRTGPGDAFATAIACLLLRLPAQYLPIFRG